MKFYANLWLGSHKDTFGIEVWTLWFSLIDKNECKENIRILWLTKSLLCYKYFAVERKENMGFPKAGRFMLDFFSKAKYIAFEGSLQKQIPRQGSGICILFGGRS